MNNDKFLKNEMNFVNLYMQSEYSFLSSTIKINSIKDIALENEYNSMAITDYSMHGVIKFYNECQKNNIKPIIGLKAKLYNENYNDYLLLYAKDEIGYKNLLKISTIINMGEVNVDLNILEEYSLGIICIIPQNENIISEYYNNHSFEEAQKKIKQYQNIFDDLYVGVSFQYSQTKNYISFLEKCNVEMVALNRTCYYTEEDIAAYQVLRCIDLNVREYTLTEAEQKMGFLSSVDASLLFKQYPYLLKNTLEISNKCNVTLEFDTYKYPKYDIENSDDYLVNLCKVGLNKRLKASKEANLNEYKNRLLYELDTIKKMGFSDYFLIVYDYVKYAKKNDIFVGPGRGSAGGSLVSYVLGITDIDPIKYNLLFERFLNPERISMPDIDVDFPDNRREEVIKYISKRYGEKRVAYIATFGTLQPRSALRDIARVTNLSDIKIKEVINQVPFGSSNLKQIVANNSLLQQMMTSDDEINSLITLAIKIEGLPRNVSTHAAGIIMADKNLDNYTPLQKGISGVYQTQYEAEDLQKLGLLKMDVLGIKNLSIIKNVLDDVKEKYNQDILLHEVDLNDKNVYKMISKGDTLGLFQLESEGVRKLLRELKASSFIDIVNATSLYRPGPMEMIPQFVQRKFNNNYEIIDQSIKDILEETYGIIVFQEQIMLIAQRFAGYSLGQADILRRAITKKKAEDLINERKHFVDSSKLNSHTEQKANEVYDYIEKFANYGFNKSHAVAYGMVAYWMAYLKTYYYKSFMASLMANSIGDINKETKYINECHKNNISVLVPNINKSTQNFYYDDQGIYYSLLGINNVGSVAVMGILEQRKNGLFTSYEDFVIRTHSFLNKKIITNIIHSGAFDELGVSRKGALDSYEDIINRYNYVKALDGKIKEVEISNEEYSFEEISHLEKAALGFNLKYNYFVKYRNLQKQYHTKMITQLEVDKKENIIFVIRSIKEIKTKNNQLMAFLTIYDETEIIDAVIFPSLYETYKEKIKVGKAYIGSIRLENKNKKLQVVIDNIYIIE